MLQVEDGADSGAAELELEREDSGRITATLQDGSLG